MTDRGEEEEGKGKIVMTSERKDWNREEKQGKKKARMG